MRGLLSDMPVLAAQSTHARSLSAWRILDVLTMGVTRLRVLLRVDTLADVVTLGSVAPVRAPREVIPSGPRCVGLRVHETP